MSHSFQQRRGRWLGCWLMLGLMLSACAAPPPIRLGFTGQLTGRNATLSTQGRNGAQLAVETINQNGGVAGRKLELLVRDDGGIPTDTVKADTELIAAGVVALTGHMTSLESMAVQDLLREKGALLFSPTTSSPALSGLDDNFFRLIPVNSAQSQPLAEYVYTERGLTQVAIIRDEDNRAYTAPYAQTFTDRYTALGGRVLDEVVFSSSAKPDFQPLMAQLQALEPEALLVIASAPDTALIAQETRQAQWPVPLLTSNWAYVNELIQNGGHAVNDILITSHFSNDCATPAYLEFKEHYQTAYGEPPAFAAVLAYETVQVLAAALAKTDGQTAGLKEALLETQNFAGLCDNFSLDAYGDVARNLYLITVAEGQFKVLTLIEPSRAP